MPTIKNGHFRLNDEDTPVYMRASIPKDLDYVRHIEIKTYDNPWEDETWLPKVDRIRVALIQKKVVGFWVGDQIRDYVRILKLAVHPKWQRRGIGSILLHDIEETYPTVTCCRVLVMEHQSDSFYALKKNGYEVVENLPEAFNIPGVWTKENAYAFEKQLPDRS